MDIAARAKGLPDVGLGVMMRAMKRLIATLVLSAAACGGADSSARVPASAPITPPASVAASVTVSTSAAAPAASAPVTEVMTADTPRALPSGVTFTVPKDWIVTSQGKMVVVQSPEKDATLVFMDVEAATADEAVASAWKAYEPDFNLKLEVAQATPAGRGWPAGRAYSYDIPPNTKRVAGAQAVACGKGFFVSLYDGAEAGFERRSGQIGQIAGTLNPPGHAKESFAGRTPHKLDAERVKILTDFVEKMRVAAGVPGVAISLVQDGKVVFAGGFGVRAMGKPAKVDADTLFIIASNTKALTTLLLAKEVEAGKFTWDTPATQVYPDFKLGDADITRQVLMHLPGLRVHGPAAAETTWRDSSSTRTRRRRASWSCSAASRRPRSSARSSSTPT